MADKSEGGVRRGRDTGRRLDETRDPVILRAALEGVADVGYDRLTMDDIAARARAGKGALYRRWPSKAALIIDAVGAWRREISPQKIPDSGSLRGDLDALVAAVPDWDEDSRRMMSVITGLVTAARRDPELAAALSGPLVDTPLELIGEVLERAVGRGEIPPERDLGLLAETVLALSVFRMVVRGEPPDRRFVRRVVDEILFPLATAPAATNGAPPARSRRAPPRAPSRRDGARGGTNS
jgi:AcrR family transcriptional regulator